MAKAKFAKLKDSKCRSKNQQGDACVYFSHAVCAPAVISQPPRGRFPKVNRHRLYVNVDDKLKKGVGGGGWEKERENIILCCGLQPVATYLNQNLSSVGPTTTMSHQTGFEPNAFEPPSPPPPMSCVQIW